MAESNDSLLVLAGLGLSAVILTQSAGAQPECIDTEWTCNTIDRKEHSNCGNTRITTPCSLASDAAEMIAGTKEVDLSYDVNGDGIIDANDVILLKTGTPLVAFYPSLLLSGTYFSNGNIYSPEIDIANNKMYFSGWYNDADYPYDAIYVTDLDNIMNVRRLLRFDPYQVGDPTIIDNNMFMTFSPNPLDGTQQKVAISTTNNNGLTWSYPSYVIEQGWLPAAVKTDKLYIYYTFADLETNQLRRAELNSNNEVVGSIIPVVFEEPGFYPVNTDVKYYDGTYYLLGDYWVLIDSIATYCIGMWTSTNGINFIAYSHNPLITPSDDNIIARTPYFIKEDNRLKIWYAQQRPDWRTNAIYYIERILY